jgi:NADH-ubiquinone oxidoreductase chain 4
MGLGLRFEWGAQPERLLAGVYIMFYTIVASLPFLGVIVVSKMSLLTPLSGTSLSSLPSMVLLMPFCVKLPMFYLHL